MTLVFVPEIEDLKILFPHIALEKFQFIWSVLSVGDLAWVILSLLQLVESIEIFVHPHGIPLS